MREIREWQRAPRAGCLAMARQPVDADETRHLEKLEGGTGSVFQFAVLHEFEGADLRIGRRLWQREYVDGNGGNIAIRVGEDIALCTPTLVSKGFMKPEDMCLVDFEGNQLAGAKKRTSEILMHLQIMKRQPQARWRRALPSAVQHGFRGGGRRAADVHDS